jgi:RimJ/RimL family protein N-acetyltransferase
MTTLHPLLPSGSAALRPLFAPLAEHLALESVLMGHSAGHILADDDEAPRAALVWTQGRAFLAGDAQEEALRAAVTAALAGQLRDDMARRGQPAFTLAYTPAWAPHVAALLADFYPLSGTRHAYTRDTETPPPAAPFSGALQPISGALLARSDLLGHAELLAEMSSERPSVTEFLMKSFGTIALRDEEIIGWCLSEYNTPDRCEFGIATAAAQRRQGVATATAAAAINQASARGMLRIGWHCWADNAPSIATARALGFSLAEVYPVAFAYVERQEALLVQGALALDEGEIGRGQAFLAQAEALGALPAWAIVHKARAQAALGRPAAALDLLHEAAAAGFVDFAALEADPYLASLRSTAGWAILRDGS